jgi:hypothetical protein
MAMSDRYESNARPPIEPALLGERDAAVFLAVSPRLLREIVRRGELPVIRIPGARRIVYSVEALRAVARRWEFGSSEPHRT